ncbi:hypothetical protein [Campylobacter lari]|uniref:hypothetical protein n=1 Tax=Campylobacter lari TaxID=201 RepID=UPI002152F395|nr:hypothetical protein [Campylobacter lari]MCR6520900.1 hypothetical protein [Campylobacter lari]
MTREQFNEIKERLAKYREIRHLTYENQQAEFLGNAFEKVSEYFKAKDDLEKVKALCDIAVFCFNAFDLKLGAFSNIKRASMIHLIDHFTSYFIEHNNKTVYNNKDEDFEYLLIVEIEILVKNLGFDFYKCMIETIKEIESRTGYYDDELKKFVNKLCAFNKDEAISNVSKDFGFLGNSIICRLTQEDKNFWFITCKEIETNLQIDYKVKKIYKADYEGCKL